MLVSVVQQSDAIIYVMKKIFFHYRLLQDIEYSYLCYALGPCCLPVLYIVVCIYSVYSNIYSSRVWDMLIPNSYFISPLLSPLSPLVTINLFSMSVSLLLCCK